MAVLVTGAAGFIGSSVTERLARLGHEVVGVDNFNSYYDPAIKWRNLEKVGQSRGFHLEQADITDNEAMTGVFDRYPIQQVIHLAARAGVRPSISDPLAYEHTNVRGTAILLELSRKFHVEQFVFGSSSSVYGVAAPVPFHEDDAADTPMSPYAATKRAGEVWSHTYHHLYGLPVTCLRFFTVYGPRQRPDLAIHRFTSAIMKNESITLFGDGSSARDYTYIDDVVAAITKLVQEKPLTGYDIINIGNSNSIRLLDLVNHLERVLDRKATITWAPAQPGDMTETFANIAKAKQLLGWQPAVPIDEGLSRFAAWYQRMN